MTGKLKIEQSLNLTGKQKRKLMHSLHEKNLPIRGRFNNISSEIWHNQQPVYYLESLGMDGLKLKPFAKVKTVE